MNEGGLRARKKARTRRAIADAAARLFAERGYEQVAVSDVAREAEVSEQTVYNYFQTKEQLVTDNGQPIQDELCRLIRTRPPATTPAAAVRALVLEVVDAVRDFPPEQWRGELGYLAATSPTVHRLALEMLDRQANAIANAIAETTRSDPRSPGCKASHSPACSKSTSARPDSAHSTGKARIRSPTSSGQPSKPCSTTLTVG